MKNQGNAIIRFGPAGWSYPDWQGLVYPKPAPKGFDPLTYLAGFFDVIEINSTFYRPPAAKSVKSWVERVRANPRFRFTAKLHQSFTHEATAPDAEAERVFRAGLQPLVDAGMLGALLLQFPWSFRNEAASRQYLHELLQRFADLSCVVEVRHASWNTSEFLEELESMGAGACNIDQPLFQRSIAPAQLVTAAVGYVRLHGRNYDQWFSQSPGGGQRYNYLYTVAELEPWLKRVGDMSAYTEAIYVITNNHFEGKALVNALELRSICENRAVPVPDGLVRRYPRLESISSAGEDRALPLLEFRE